MNADAVIQAVSDAARSKGATHCVLSQRLYDVYRANIIAKHKKRSIKYATAHGTSLLPVDWLPSDIEAVILAFDQKDKRAKKLMHQIREEFERDSQVEQMRDLLSDLISNGKNVTMTHVKEEK